MAKKIPLNHLGFVVLFGAVWGLSETALGAAIEKCASFASGSIMTGVAFFFIAATWILSRNILGLFLLVSIASLFKMFDALLLSLPLQHGAVANPIFAFWMEALAFFVLMTIVDVEASKKKTLKQALLGGMSALLAANFFPLVKYVTGIPACVFPGTNYPLALYFLPLAVCVSLLSVPCGLWAGEKVRDLEGKIKILSPATFILSLAIIALIRLG